MIHLVMFSDKMFDWVYPAAGVAAPATGSMQ